MDIRWTPALAKQFAVLARDRDGAERTIRRVLEQQLGGAAGVVDAFLAAGGLAYGTTAPECPAAERWRAAELAALDAVRIEFPALVVGHFDVENNTLVLRLAGQDLDEALAEGFVTIGATRAGSIEAPAGVAG